jgi:hypothetical protein
MGLVYRARQRRPDRLVAIKVIAPELAADPGFRARFEQESATAAEIEHPNVIPVYEVGEDEGLVFLAMRFVSGVDLRQLLRQEGRIEPERAGRIVAQIADALDAAHARGLVHRDVKPANILLADRDHVYLTDFGLTKRTADSHGMTQTGMFVGTVDYIAPEQIEGGRVDARADVYALGCVTYQLLSGEVPFPRDSDLAKIFAHVNDPPPRLTNVPEQLAGAVERAMAKDPADRFLSAGDFGRAVLAGVAGQAQGAGERTVAVGEAAIAGGPPPTKLAPTKLRKAPAPEGAVPEDPVAKQAPPGGAPPPATPADAATSSRRPRWIVAAAGLLVVLVAVGVAIALARGGPKAHATDRKKSGSKTVSTPVAKATTPAATVTKIFDPTNASGGLAVSVTATVKGNCWTTSIVAERPDAYRCMVGNDIYDPCFGVSQAQALCPSGGPWTNRGLLLNSPPPSGQLNKDDGTSGPPWALQLSDGINCVELSGATEVIAGQTLSYGCGEGVGLYGDVNRSAQAWTIFEGKPHSATLSQQPIAVAWF